MRRISILFIIFCALFPFNSYADQSCLFSALGEIVLPGSGYIYNSQYDKAALIGGGRWVSAYKYNDAKNTDGYQDDPDDIYDSTSDSDSASGKNEQAIYMNRATWNAEYYSTIYQNLTFVTLWDLYEHDCQPNNDTYIKMAAPFRVDHYYDNWMFWVPIGILAVNYANFDENNKIDWYLGDGLTKSNIKNDTFSKYYSVGVGEEMFFRGIIQKHIFVTMKDSWGWSPETSRHSAIFAGAAIFGAAHTGAGNTANSTSAFLAGLYLGYAYQPSIDEYDLTTAIAIHAWWDIIVAYTIINHSTFYEKDEEVKVPIASVSFTY